jgi:hypothetical protein
MSSISETGHDINLNKHDEVITGVEAFGSDYDPTNAKLATSNQRAGNMAARAAQKQLNKLEESSRKPVHDRQDLFEKLKDVVPRSVRYYESTGVSKVRVTSVKALAKKILRSNPLKKLPDGSIDPNSISTSQLSFGKKEANFRHLVDFYESDPLYNPNLTDLSIADMKLYLGELEKANRELDPILQEVDDARIKRNELMYGPDGIITQVQAIKSYVESMAGISSPRAKAIRAIKFTLLR